jgi:hypothetical protein
MLKCPFCHFENEEGALFCEQCKSDLAGVETAVMATPAAAPVAQAQVVETIPLAAEMPLAAPVVEATAAEAVATPVMEAMPLAAPVAEVAMAVPLAPPLEAVPVAPPAAPPPPAAPVAEAPVAPPVAEAPAAPLAAPAAPAAAAAPAAPAAEAPTLPTGAQPRLLVLRGQKRNVEYPIYEGLNFIGRADEKPVDIDLEDQEPPDRVWSSRQHAVIAFEENKLLIEDLNSSNGTFVNRARIYPGQKRGLAVNDVIQIGNVQLKVIV